ncbi:NUDIX domain-containing protein [Glycomyces sp. TRM65418]|uniref:NUDIX domain-containing protein n=1 Tax=Glycomyces sp. TRM65418 TaxID=2867006 RepID=UPI001CE70533|nr:NUDIX domain-containing protein [Glycomyces sp. TRM65418]MCC3762107.1 NUDIX domain-containing protein [Glycomyces sp. TRM65418]QZD56174.1 NUDIX domain-containing protein [Glycomyces sp. TRM65418]
MREFQDFRQRAAAYVMRRAPERAGIEVLVILHRDAPEAGVQVPGGGAHAHETIGEAAIREAREETGVRGLVFGEALGNMLLRAPVYEHGHQVTTYCWLRSDDARDAWDHTVVSTDEDDGERMRCEFRPVGAAGIDFEMDRFLPQAAARFAAAFPVEALAEGAAEAVRAPGVAAPAPH